MIWSKGRWIAPIFLDSDGGGEGGGGGSDPVTPPADPVTTPPPETTPEPELTEPKYFAQLPGEKAKSDSYKTLYKYQNLDSLTDAFIETQAELEKAKKDSERSIVVPEKGDKEGIDAFFRKLGVPDNPEDYDFSTLSNISDEYKAVIPAIQKACKRFQLTKRQGDAVSEMLSEAAKAVTIRFALKIRDNVKNQESMVSSSYVDKFPSEVDRNKAASEDVSLYESFLNETGLGEIINKSTIAGNPAVIRRIAAYARKHNRTIDPNGQSIGAGKKAEGKSVVNESNDWKEFKASRR